MVTPVLALPEITLRSAGVAPPTVLPALAITIPLPPFGAGSRPFAVVPIRLPATTLPPARSRRPVPLKPWITNPRNVPPAPLTSRPSALAPADEPSSTTHPPLCVVPSIVTGPVMLGSALVGWITFPVLMLKTIRSAPARAFAAMIASRSVQSAASQTPSSWSAAVLTTKSLTTVTGTAKRLLFSLVSVT